MPDAACLLSVVGDPQPSQTAHSPSSYQITRGRVMARVKPLVDEFLTSLPRLAAGYNDHLDDNRAERSPTFSPSPSDQPAAFRSSPKVLRTTFSNDEILEFISI